ncbi:LamG domain-containing protein, partial [Rhodopirellula bahusiensis]
GASETFTVKLRRIADDSATWTIPRIELDRVFIGESTRIELPSVSTPVKLQLAAVPADYFSGENNQCLEVTGERSAIRVDSDSLALPNGPFTLEAWLNPSQTEGMRGVVAKTQSSEFAIFSDEGVPQFDVNLDGKYYSAKAKDKLAVNEWTHVAGAFDGENVRIYVSGKQIASVSAKGKRKTNRYPLYVGADPDNAGQPTRSFLGKIDEVRITTGAVYTDDFEPARRLSPTADTRLLLHLDRTLGPYVLDHSPAAGMGTLGPNSKFSAR